ncbi:MAG: hypothetical protein QF415_10050 [Candidatus Undinarchaeales archaeon]|jgi:hypothetical protein|nr:hypothetical protein [Candidatus Undinarchaeales archaeon]MDP7494517.1 hypothetical protein [Candidatus Undinarchaeales archaeon]
MGIETVIFLVLLVLALLVLGAIYISSGQGEWRYDARFSGEK